MQKRHNNEKACVIINHKIEQMSTQPNQICELNNGLYHEVHQESGFSAFALSNGIHKLFSFVGWSNEDATCVIEV